MWYNLFSSFINIIVFFFCFIVYYFCLFLLRAFEVSRKVFHANLNSIIIILFCDIEWKLKCVNNEYPEIEYLFILFVDDFSGLLWHLSIFSSKDSVPVLMINGIIHGYILIYFYFLFLFCAFLYNNNHNSCKHFHVL